MSLTIDGHLTGQLRQRQYQARVHLQPAIPVHTDMHARAQSSSSSNINLNQTLGVSAGMSEQQRQEPKHLPRSEELM